MEEFINMKLHEQKTVLNGQFCITRVPGGWIYDRQEPTANILNSVFVPINYEGFLAMPESDHGFNSNNGSTLSY